MSAIRNGLGTVAVSAISVWFRALSRLARLWLCRVYLIPPSVQTAGSYGSAPRSKRESPHQTKTEVAARGKREASGRPEHGPAIPRTPRLSDTGRPDRSPAHEESPRRRPKSAAGSFRGCETSLINATSRSKRFVNSCSSEGDLTTCQTHC